MKGISFFLPTLYIGGLMAKFLGIESVKQVKEMNRRG